MAWLKIVARSGAQVGLAVLATCLFFYRAALTRDLFSRRDLQRVYYPLRQFWADRVRHGHLPEWYPFDGLGQPFIGMGISAVFHPSTLLYAVLPLGTALKWNLLLAYAAALLGTWVLARRWGATGAAPLMASVGYAFNGYAISMSNNLLYVVGLATLPWVLWAADLFAERGSVGALMGTALLAASILCVGDLQVFVCALLCVCVIILIRSQARITARLLRAGSAVALTFMLGAVQLFPALAIRHSAKGGENLLQHAVIWSGHPTRLLEIALGPLYLDPLHEKVGSSLGLLLDPTMGTEWADSVHVGAVIILFALLGAIAWRRKRSVQISVGGILLVLVLWLGRHAKLYALFYDLVPGWKTFRYPEKLTPLLVLGLCLFAALGLQTVESGLHQRRRAVKAAGAGTLALLLLAGLEWKWKLGSEHGIAKLWPQLDAAGRGLFGHNLLLALLQSAAALFAVLLALTVVRRPLLRGTLLVGSVGLNLFVANEAVVWVAPPRFLVEKAEFLEKMQELEGREPTGAYRYSSEVGGASRFEREDDDSGPFMAWVLASALRPDFPALWGFESADGYLPAVNRRLRWANFHSLLDAGYYNTHYVALNAVQFKQARIPPKSVAAQLEGMGLYLIKLPTALPRVYVADPRCVPTLTESQPRIHDKALKWGREAVVECGAGSVDVPAPDTGAAGTAALVHYEPEFVEAEVKANRDALLVLNDAYYAGWSATLDGAPTPILPTNVIVRGVRVPAGHHLVRFRYQTPGLLAGVSVTGTGLAVALLLWFVERSRARVRHGARSIPASPGAETA